MSSKEKHDHLKHSSQDVFKKFLLLKDESAYSEDHLSFLLILVKWIRNYKSLLMLVVFLFLVNLYEIIYYLVDVLASFDSKLVVKYGGHAGIQVFMMASLGNAIVIGRRVAVYGIKFQRKLLPLTFAKKRTQKKIIMKIRLLKMVVYCDIVCSVISAGFFFMDKSFNENDVYFFIISKNIFSSDLAKFVFLLYRISYFLIAFVAIGGAFMMCYISVHAIFQIIILEDFIEHICDGKNDDETNQYYNEMNQRLIAERLKICIMLHQLVYSEVRNFMVIAYNTTLVLVIGMLFMGGGIMILLFRDAEIHTSPAGCFFITVSSALNTALYAVAGQLIKNESEDLRVKLSNLPWYNMNKQNKVLLCIFLMRTENLVSFDINLIQIDYSLMVRISRGLYSLSTLISQSMKIKNK